MGRDRQPSPQRARSVYPFLRRLARRLGYHLTFADYYSPIPDRWTPAAWEHPVAMPGVDLRLDASLSLLAELAPHIRDYAPPAEPPGTAHGYHHLNGMYPQVDGEILFAMVRHLRPARILEIGAGWSSRVVADAVALNAAEGHPVTEHRILDPFPPPELRSLATTVEPLAAESLEPSAFSAFEPGDLLFVDTTHTVKPGNDVLRLLLEVIPQLPVGVVVHLHDVFLPYCYPEFLFDAGRFWQEQYLVQAFLAFNPAFEVLMANYALMRQRAEDVDEAVPGLSSHTHGSALWLRHTGL